MTTETKRTAYTPGPWRAVEALPGHDRDWSITRVGRGVMAEVYERGGVVYDDKITDEAKANARLIAAAPELVEALGVGLAFADRVEEAMRQLTTNIGQYPKSFVEVDNFRTIVRAALRAAGVEE